MISVFNLLGRRDPQSFNVVFQDPNISPHILNCTCFFQIMAVVSDVVEGSGRPNETVSAIIVRKPRSM